ncbi:putative odorant-binding protein A5 [Episyrphus balteatus]|uniref:putative odorant-binding protein A5 n=1 Tax=Episyrphus balteatus TaxID=286459 RepID=UPI0024851D53|nr:putative odorant-binding protein A5 [Episyrphus balteatus]
MKKLILLIALIFTVASAAETEITKKMKEFEIIPNIVQSNVPELLKISFDSGASVNMGNEITPSQAKKQPKVEWKGDKNAYYTLVAFGPDAPTPDNPFISNIITWMVGNISTKDVGAEHILAEYFAAAPPRETKKQRLIFLMFKQPKKLQFDEKPINKYTVEGRLN